MYWIVFITKPEESEMMKMSVTLNLFMASDRHVQANVKEPS